VLPHTLIKRKGLWHIIAKPGEINRVETGLFHRRWKTYPALRLRYATTEERDRAYRALAIFGTVHETAGEIPRKASDQTVDLG